jgi:hypothetical protein
MSRGSRRPERSGYGGLAAAPAPAPALLRPQCAVEGAMRAPQNRCRSSVEGGAKRRPCLAAQLGATPALPSGCKAFTQYYAAAAAVAAAAVELAGRPPAISPRAGHSAPARGPGFCPYHDQGVAHSDAGGPCGLGRRPPRRPAGRSSAGEPRRRAARRRWSGLPSRAHYQRKLGDSLGCSGPMAPTRPRRDSETLVPHRRGVPRRRGAQQSL